MSASSASPDKSTKDAASKNSRSGPTIQYDQNVTNQSSRRPRRRRPSLKDIESTKPRGESDWWFASTAIPLLAATLGPLANVLSIAALVTSWRETVFINGQFVSDFDGIKFPDPKWCYWINVVSLIFGFIGNLFLLFNFTQRIPYLIALPATILSWYLSTGFLTAITICMHLYQPPNLPNETYTQGFWYAITASAMYFICSTGLLVNMLGFFLRHYRAQFRLTDPQRTLILQTMLFFIWLAGGAAVFSSLETHQGEQGWEFADALYFCDVTILTVGFGDLYPTDNVGRGLVLPYAVIGTIILALVVTSIFRFVRELGEENVIRKFVERHRSRTISRDNNYSFDLPHRNDDITHPYSVQHRLHKRRPIRELKISGPMDSRPAYRKTAVGALVRLTPFIRSGTTLAQLVEEKDRFNKMRDIQRSTARFKKYLALTTSFLAFIILWTIGAVVFWRTERLAQPKLTYFQSLYFCYVSLLTIGYGDLSPKTNAGRCFFVVWSLIAVPTMTTLVSAMADTVVRIWKDATSKAADWTVLPKEGVWWALFGRYPRALGWIKRLYVERRERKKIKRGFEVADPERMSTPRNDNDGDVEGDADPRSPNAETTDEEAAVDDHRISRTPSLHSLAEEAASDEAGRLPNPSILSTHIALSIKRVAKDLAGSVEEPKKYSYEEWVEFKRLIRITKSHVQHGGPGSGRMEGPNGNSGFPEGEEEEYRWEWDWIGEDSPLVANMSECEWLLKKLCESLVRLEKRKLKDSRGHVGKDRDHGGDKEADRGGGLGFLVSGANG